jgi:hypothetical protein
MVASVVACPVLPLAQADELTTAAIAAALACGVALGVVTREHLDTFQRAGAAVTDLESAVQYRAAMIGILNTLTEAAAQLAASKSQGG